MRRETDEQHTLSKKIQLRTIKCPPVAMQCTKKSGQETKGTGSFFDDPILSSPLATPQLVPTGVAMARVVEAVIISASCLPPQASIVKVGVDEPAILPFARA